MVAPGTPEQTQWLSKPVVQLGEIQAPLIEVLQALRAVGHLFLRNPPLRMIQNSGTEWSSVLAKLSASAKSTRMIEYLDVMDRSILVPAAVRVLEKWPASFLSFCESTGITRVHFNGADHLQPPWMTEVVNMRLALQNRFVSKVVLQKAVADLQAEIGHMPSVTALRSRLRWQGEKGLSDLFPPKRLEATDAEWRSFVKSCHEALDQFGHVALRSRMACSNDLIAILLELLAAHGLKLAPQPSREDMIATLSDARFIHILEDSRLANLVDRLLRTMKDDLKCSHRELSREHASARQVAKRYKALTLRFPNDLARKVGVLLVPARKDSLRGQIQPTCCIDRLSLPS